MSVILNNRQWKKSYMLEFLYDNGRTEVFTFSVPPESEDFNFSHRIAETKTYGGSVFDSYGNDTVKINLSGSTINEEKKLIYRGNRKMPSYMTGEEEIWELQRLIKESQDINNKGTLEVYLYDLSKMGGGLQKGLNMMYGPATKNWWRVYIKEFKIKRDKSKPNTYNYTMELLGLDDKSHQWIEKLESSNFLGIDLLKLKEDVNSISNDIIKYSDDIEMYTELGAQVVKYTGEAISALLDVVDVYKDDGFLAGTLELSNGIVRIINGTNAVNDVYHACVDAYKSIFDLFTGNFTAKRKGKSWEIIQTYTINFYSDGGTNIKPQRIKYGDMAIPPENPTKDFYDFIGWYYNDILYDFTTPITQNITLVAKWIKNTVKVTFSPNGGSSVPAQYVRIGGKVSVPTDPVKDGYVFSKWTVDSEGTTGFDFNTEITEDKLLYAQWISAVYVEFDSNGGTEVETQMMAPGCNAFFPSIPAKPDCALVYWATDEDLTTEYDFATPVTKSIKLYAKWKQITATLTFESNGGSYVYPVVVTYNHTTPTPKSEKDGYTLYGWYKDRNLTDQFFFDTTPCTESMTLYAKWVPAELEIEFDVDGGTEVEAQTVTYDGLVIYPVIPSKEGNTFIWWEYDKEIPDENDKDKTIIVRTRYDFTLPVKESFTLYAKWFAE